MKLSANIRPRKVTGNSKQDIRSRIGALGLTISKHYSGATQGLRDPKNVIMINYEKRKPVKVQSAKTFNGKNGKVRKTEVLEKGHWVAHYYTFPIDLLKALNIRVVQHSRNFTIEKV